MSWSLNPRPRTSQVSALVFSVLAAPPFLLRCLCCEYFVSTSEMRKQVRDASKSLKGVGARILNPHIQDMVVASAPLDSRHLSVG